MKRKREWSFVFFGIFVLLCGAYSDVFSHVLCNPDEVMEKILNCSPVQDTGPSALGYEREALRFKEKASEERGAVETRECFFIAIPVTQILSLDGFGAEDGCWQPEMFGGE